MDIYNQLIDEIKKIVRYDTKEHEKLFIKFSKQGYNPVEISNKNFHQINEENNEQKMCFIDGGSAEVIRSADISLAFIRLCAVIVKNNKKEEIKTEERFVLTKSIIKQENIIYKSRIYSENSNIFEKNEYEFDSKDPNICKGGNRASISEIFDIIRKFAELKLAKEMVNILSENDIIILDNSLEAKSPIEEKYFEELYKKAIVNKTIVCGLNKTTSLFLNNGKNISAVLNQISKDNLRHEKSWYYHPVAQISNPLHKAEMMFLKLNNKSKYIFRFEIYKEQYISEQINKIISLLAYNSKDPVFLGYPYGLILADRFARVSNKEKEYLKIKLLTKLGKDFDNLKVHLHSIDAHSVLDNIG